MSRCSALTASHKSFMFLSLIAALPNCKYARQRYSTLRRRVRARVPRTICSVREAVGVECVLFVGVATGVVVVAGVGARAGVAAVVRAAIGLGAGAVVRVGVSTGVTRRAGVATFGERVAVGTGVVAGVASGIGTGTRSRAPRRVGKRQRSALSRTGTSGLRSRTPAGGQAVSAGSFFLFLVTCEHHPDW
jgi:hypothetical protein